MHNGSFPCSCVWSILIKSELAESEPPWKQKDFDLADQWRGPSSADDRTSFPISWLLFIISPNLLHSNSASVNDGNGRMQNKSWNWLMEGGGTGRVFRSGCCHLQVTFTVERWGAVAGPVGGGGKRHHHSGTISTPAETRCKQRQRRAVSIGYHLVFRSQRRKWASFHPRNRMCGVFGGERRDNRKCVPAASGLLCVLWWCGN